MTPLDLGSYEKRIGADGRELVTGLCAGCGFLVTVHQRHAVRHHPTEPGGIFHDEPAPFDCAPVGAGWYGLGEPEGAGE